MINKPTAINTEINKKVTRPRCPDCGGEMVRIKYMIDDGLDQCCILNGWICDCVNPDKARAIWLAREGDHYDLIYVVQVRDQS